MDVKVHAVLVVPHIHFIRICTVGTATGHGVCTDKLPSGLLHSVSVVIGHHVVVDVAVDFEELVTECSLLERIGIEDLNIRDLLLRVLLIGHKSLLLVHGRELVDVLAVFLEGALLDFVDALLDLLVHLTLEAVSDQKICDRHTRDKTRGEGNDKIRFH